VPVRRPRRQQAPGVRRPGGRPRWTYWLADPTMGLAGGVVNDPTTGGTGTLGTVEVEGRRRHPGWYL